jgi:CO/xanthine dehydrogenase Mo-binding subunit
MTTTLDTAVRGRQRSQIGRALPRPEDPALLRGSAPFVADIRVPGCLDAAFVRSWLAHGRLRSISAGPARQVPGVVAAWSAVDLPDLPEVPVPFRGGPVPMPRPALATDRVRFVGEPVAVVVATDRYRAEDGAEQVEVDIEPLPAVVDPVAATADEVRLFDGVSNVSSESELGRPCGDEFAACDVVVETTVRNQRVVATAMEPRGILVRPEPGGALTVWCSHQAPHRLRDAIADAFGLARDAVRVIVPAVGGAFGAKSQTYPEYLVVAAAAVRLNRPVRWIEDRYEALVASTHGRGQVTRVRLGLDSGGRFRALDADILADVGAYPHTGDFIGVMSGWMMSGTYVIPSVHVRARGVVTTTVPTSAYRGAGRPEAAYAVERIVDLAAEAVGLDPVEIRRRNLIPPDAFPYRSPTGALYDSGRYADALDLALREAGYDGWRTEQRRRRLRGDRRQLGIGVATWIERSGGPAGSPEYARVEIAPDGEVLARVGISSQGQGHAGTIAQVVAEALSLDPATVRVVAGDTGEVASGTGTFGSRSMQIGGNAAYLAACEVADRARATAAGLLGVAVEAVELVEGRLRAPHAEIPLARVAAHAGGLAAETTFAPPQAFPYGCYVAVVEVDTRTGDVSVLRLVAVDDCGVVVNPLVVRGQVIGSIVQGLGQALYEAVRYDGNGQPQTSTLLDYTVPTAAEVPPLTLLELQTPNPNVPLGTKGTGESGCIGTPPAVVGAVYDALRGYDRSGLEMPITPARVWTCLQRPVPHPETSPGAA